MIDVSDRSFRRHASDFDRYVDASERGTRRVGAAWDRLKLRIAAALSTAAIGMFVRSLVSVNSALEQTQVRFETLLGSASAANRMIRDLYAFSARTPFEFEGLAAASSALLGFGANADEVLDHLQLLGDVAAGTGGSLERMADIYGRAMVRGRMTGNNLQDLVRQSIPIYEKLAEVTGRGADEIEDMVSRGEIGFRDLQQAFRNLTTEGGLYFESLERGSQTMQGMISTLNTLRTQLMQEIGRGLFESLRDDLEAVTERATELHESGRLAEWGRRAGDAIRTLYERLRSVVMFLHQYGGAILRVTAVVAAWRAGTIAVATAIAAKNTAVATGRAVIAAYQAAVILLTAAKAALTGNIVRAQGAMVAFNMLVRANPLGILISLLTAAGAAFLVFRRRTDDAADGIDAIRENAEEARKALDDMTGAMLRQREAELRGEHAKAQGNIADLMARRGRLTEHVDALGPAGDPNRRLQLMRRIEEIDRKITEEATRRVELYKDEQRIGEIINNNLQARLEYLRAQQDELAAAGQSSEELNQEIAEIERLMSDLRAKGIDVTGPSGDDEAVSRAQQVLESISRAQQLVASMTDGQRRALQEVWEAQDQINALLEVQATLGADAVRPMMQAAQERLANARSQLAAEEEIAGKIRDHGVLMGEVVEKVRAWGQQTLGFGETFGEFERVLASANGEVEAMNERLAELRDELLRGAITQEEYERRTAEAAQATLQKVRTLYDGIIQKLNLTNEQKDQFRELLEEVLALTDDAGDSTRKYGTALSDLAASIRALGRLADVFGDLDDGVRRLIDGTADLLDNFQRLQNFRSTIGDGGPEAGSFGAVVGQAMPVIGMMAGVTSAISGLISSNRESKAEMERLSQSLRDAAREIRASIEDMWRDATIGEDVSRADISQAERSIGYLRAGMSFIGMEDALARIEGTGIDFLSGIGDTFREQVAALEEQFKVGLRMGAITEQDIVRMAAGRVFGSGVIDQALEDLAASLGQAGASVAGATRLFDQLVKAGVSVEDAFEEVGSFLQENVGEIPGFLSDWLGELMQMDLGSDAFTEAVQEMLRASMQDGFNLEGMTPRAFNDLIDFLLGVPGRIDASEIEEGASALETAFNRLRILQQYTDIDPQRAFDTFLTDLLAMGDELTPTLQAELKNLFSTIDLSSEEGAQALLDWVNRAGRGLADGMLDLGDMDETEFEAVLQIFQNLALGVEDVFEGIEDVFKSGVDGAVQALNILTRYMGVDAATAMRQFTTMLRGAGEDVPEEARALLRQASAVDVTTAEGRAQLQEIITAVGALMLGADDDERRVLQQIADGFQQIVDMPQPEGEDRTSRSVQYLRSITEFQGQEIVLSLSALEHWARQQLAQLELIASHTSALAGLQAAVDNALAGATPKIDAQTIQQLTANRTINLGGVTANIQRAFSERDDVDVIVDAIASALRDELRQTY